MDDIIIAENLNLSYSEQYQGNRPCISTFWSDDCHSTGMMFSLFLCFLNRRSSKKAESLHFR